MSELIFDDTIFAVSNFDIIDNLIREYNHSKKCIDEIADITVGTLGAHIHYFIDGNDNDRRWTPSVSELFKRENAYKALNSAYWSRTLNLTDVYDCMPEKRREEWNTQIREMKCLNYEENIVRPTIKTLLDNRGQYLAERVDGIFRNLSGLHVTNSPFAFGKRMIISYLTSYHGNNVGYINDLRCVIAKFMGRDNPKWYHSSRLIDQLKDDTGTWYSLDGGALKIRLYKKGTAHLEVHPDIAWRLNKVLATLYPNVIPAESRKKPVKKTKDVVLLQKPLPFEVLEMFDSRKRNVKSFSFPYGSDKNSFVYQETLRVLLSIGGVLNRHGSVDFDYNIDSVLKEISNFGCVPDHKSHQYYPTPKRIAQAAISLAEINSSHSILEPSAGQGNIVDLLPDCVEAENITCVEISELHCKILETKGYTVVNEDFMKFDPSSKFDRIIMNPPYSDGRWQAHIEAAYSLLKSGGKIVAILPVSAKGKKICAGNIIWHETYNNEFIGTSVSVIIVTINKP